MKAQGQQQTFFTDGPSLEQARADFEAALDEGTKCPCCRRYAKRYRRTIYDTMAKVLIAVCQKTTPTGDYVELRRSAENGGDYAKLCYWGLLKAHPDRAKLYRPTAKALAFLRGEIQVPRYCHVYNDRPEYFSGEPMTIHDCLGEHFDLGAMMAGAGGIPREAPGA